MSGTDPIPAVREEDATGDTAAIFADLRGTLAVPFVNLIWRHLATIPGGLPAVWETLKPLYASGELGRRLPALRAAIGSTGGAVTIPDHVWTCAGLRAGERARIADLIAQYNHANGVNFLALLVAVALLRGEAKPGGGQLPGRGDPPRPPPGREGVSPRLLGLSELTPATLEVVRDLDGFGRLGDSAAIASLYRHLAHWPVFLSLAHTALAPEHRSGALRAAQERVIRAGAAQANELAAALPAGLDIPDDAARAKVLGALDEFTRLMIGRMIVMGDAMGRLLPAGSGA